MSTVVFLHAFPCDHRMWEPQMQDVRAAGWDAVALDLPGFAGTALPATEPTLDSVADGVLMAVAAGVGTERVVLVGVSLGGYVAMSILRRHPERVGALVLCDTKATVDSPEAKANRERLASLIEDQPTESGRILEQAVLPGLLGQTTHEQRPDVVDQVRAWLHEADPRTVAWYQRAMAARPDSLAALAAFSGPSAIIWGEEDQLSPWHEQERMAQLLPNARMVRVAGAGHLANVERPVEVTSGILDFLGSLAR
jgi:pimeloyl-ACP methyl ester carboxylesterase